MDENASRFIKDADYPKDVCDSKKISLEDDEDSGIEIGPISFHDRGDILIPPGW